MDGRYLSTPVMNSRHVYSVERKKLAHQTKPLISQRQAIAHNTNNHCCSCCLFHLLQSSKTAHFAISGNLLYPAGFQLTQKLSTSKTRSSVRRLGAVERFSNIPTVNVHNSSNIVKVAHPRPSSSVPHLHPSFFLSDFASLAAVHWPPLPLPST